MTDCPYCQQPYDDRHVCPPNWELADWYAQTGYPWTKTVGPPHSSGDVPGQTYTLRSNDLICGPPAPWWHWRRWLGRWV
jgi:hypothetical protein